MSEPLDVFVLLGRDNYDWIGQTPNYHDAALLIRNYGKEGVFFVHSEVTGCRTFFASSNGNLVQFPGKPRD